MSVLTPTPIMDRSTLFLALAILASLFVSTSAQAGAISCDGEVKSVLLYARGQSEGNVVVKIKLDGGSTYVWTLCNLNEDKLVGGVATSKNGAELIAAQESYSATCQETSNMAHIAKATGKKLRLAFLDNVFPTCADVPAWGGILGADTDDPAGRLGAWDGFFYIEVLDADAG